MINNEDEHPIPPIWRHEKLICLKTGCHATPLLSNFFLGPVAPSFQFLTPSASNKFQGEPLQWGVKYMGCGKIAIFDCSRCLSWKWYKIGLQLLWNVNRKSQVADRCVSIPMTLSNPERRDTRVKFFRWISDLWCRCIRACIRTRRGHFLHSQ